jgi:hypothetical protein
MTQPPIDQPEEDYPPKIDFELVQFPSDSLSIKRLRTMFPGRFSEGKLGNGFGHFFYPMDYERPPHLVRLNQLLSAERTMASYAFYMALENYPGEFLREEHDRSAATARREMEEYYQEFKLADSPAIAKLLIQHVEEEGQRQGENLQSGHFR